MDWDEPTKQPSTRIELGEDLSTMSIEELSARIALLESEIERYRTTIGEKEKQRAAADDVFKN